MNDDSHFLMSMGAAKKNEGNEYHGQRCIEIAESIERLRAEAATAFERGKDVGKAIGWEAAKRDTSKLLGLDGGHQQIPQPEKSK